MGTLGFHSKGKLLLSGEYLVLKGAKGLAIPLRFGQSLVVTKADDMEFIKWTSYVKRDRWFWGDFNNALAVKEASDQSVALGLQNILRAAKKLNPAFLPDDLNLDVKSYIDFNIDWGLGSSSSLISNIAWWADVDPFELHFAVSNGSGYDVACARSELPLLYRQVNQNVEVEEVLFNPGFREQIAFVYTGNKQNSQKSVAHFNQNVIVKDKIIEKISLISEDMAVCKSLEVFTELMDEHEQIVSELINEVPVKEKSFMDFNGSLKSLGAWGGDFLMVVSNDPFEQTRQYFKQKGLDVVIRFNDIVFQ